MLQGHGCDIVAIIQISHLPNKGNNRAYIRIAKPHGVNFRADIKILSLDTHGHRIKLAACHRGEEGHFIAVFNSRLIINKPMINGCTYRLLAVK